MRDLSNTNVRIAGGEDTKGFRCQQCSHEPFDTHGELRRHLANTHGGQTRTPAKTKMKAR